MYLYYEMIQKHIIRLSMGQKVQWLWLNKMQKKSRYRKEILDVLTLSATHYVDKIYHIDIHKDCSTYILLFME